MLQLAKSLKEQTQTANKIIRRDTEVVQASSRMTDKNFGSLKKESDKLQEHSKRAWKCWMWLMIGLVMAIFICESHWAAEDVANCNLTCLSGSPFSYGAFHETDEEEGVRVELKGSFNGRGSL